MAFVTGLPDKTDAARRTAAGEKHLPIPDCGLDEVRVTHQPCKGCQKNETHNLTTWINHRIPFGDHRNENVPTANAILAGDLDKLQSGLFSAWASVHNYITWYPSNVGGTANNMTQSVRYTITSASGNTLTLVGRNPKSIPVSNSVLNPDFVAPGLGESRLLSETKNILLPVGACVVFSGNSVAGFKGLQPIITEINPPVSDTLEGVSFTVECSCDISSAVAPVDLAFPQDSYWCEIHFEANSPQRWGNFQEFPESQFTVTKAKHSSAAVHTLKNSAGDDTRILYPDMKNIVPWLLDNGPFRAMVYKTDGTIEKIESTAAKALLNTTQSPSGWVATFDASGISDVDFVVYTYCPEALEGDRYKRSFTSCCSNSQVEKSGSYEHKDGRLCGDITASEFDTYEAECWQPECDQFGLACKDGQYGQAPAVAVDGLDGGLLSSYWTRTPWVERKLLGSSAASAFVVFRPSGGGPGFGCLTGGYANDTPVDLQDFSVTELQQPLFGNLVEWTDSGDDYMTVAVGTWYEKGADNTGSGGPDTRFDGSTYRAGMLDFGGGNPLGPSTYTEVDRMPTKNGSQYIGGCDVSSTYTHSGQNTTGAVVKWSSVQSWATKVEMDTVNDTLNDEAQARF
jgi:hypothetical protein